MALIKCDKCGKEISDKTKKCVHCGAKILSEKQKLVLEIKKENKKRRRKLFKTIFLTFLVIVIIPAIYFGIMFLFPRKSINFKEKYSDYFKYAFGEDVSVVETNKYKYFYKLGFMEFYEWTITYRDDANTVNEIVIYNDFLTNFSDIEVASDYVFASEILYRYREIVNNYMRSGSISKLDDHINIIENSTLGLNEYYKGLPNLIKPGTGLSFTDPSLSNLDSKLYYLSMDVYYSSGSNVNEYTKGEAIKIINHYNIKNAVISAGISNTNPVYCIKDGVEINCPFNNDLDSMNNKILDKSDYIYLD